MPTQKKFFIYFLLLIAFFIFSYFAIKGMIYTTYKYKSFEIKSKIPMTAEVQATNVNGFVKGKILNNSEQTLENKYIKVECFSKNNTLMGTKYIKIENIAAKSSYEYEVRFNYNRIERIVLDIVDEISENVTEEDKISDPQMNFAGFIAKLMIL